MSAINHARSIAGRRFTACAKLRERCNFSDGRKYAYAISKRTDVSNEVPQASLRPATGADPGLRPPTQPIRECRFARRIARTQSPVASAQILRCRETLPWGPPDPTRAPFPPPFLTLLNGSRE